MQRTRLLISGAALALAMAGCATVSSESGAPELGAPSSKTWLYPADASSNLIAGAPLYLRAYPGSDAGAATGQDAVNVVTLLKQDGRVMAFQEANHAPFDLMAQNAEGPLAQVMGFFGEERPTLYQVSPELSTGAPFLCGPDGPAYIGYYRDADDKATLVGLRSGFSFTTGPDGSAFPEPYSPSEVCARLKLDAVDAQ